MRAIIMILTGCAVYIHIQAQNVGINQPGPTQKLDVNGKMKIGDDTAAPQPGTIRWNAVSKDFEGFDGINWISFSKKNWGNEVKLVAPDGTTNNRFGHSVSISGVYAVVGAHYHQIGNNGGQGAAYVFERDGTDWNFQTKLIASDGNEQDYFGYSVAMQGDEIYIGATGESSNKGAVYYFVRNGSTWTEQAKLTASDGENGDGFGSAVSVSGNYLLVGAPFDNINNVAYQGSAYIFNKDGSWLQQAKVTMSDGIWDAFFGKSVSIHGDYALIGCHREAAYIFYRSGTTWTQQTRLIASDGASDDYFGRSVSLYGTYAVVGAYLDDIGENTNQGSAYIFIRSGTSWAQQVKITASHGAPHDNFGYSVFTDGTSALVGAIYKDISVQNQGSVYLFSRSGSNWSQSFLFTARDGLTEDLFGFSVSKDGDYMLIGSVFNDVTGQDQGSAYIFSK